MEKPRLDQAISITRQKADALLNAGEADRAKSLYAQLSQSSPADPGIYRQLGKASLMSGELSEAEKHLLHALELRPDSEAYNTLGAVCMRMGRVDQAAECFEAALQLEPSALAHYNLATVRLQQQRLDEAIGHYRQALAYAPERPEIHNNLANALRLQGQYVQAESAYRAALQLRGDSSDAYEEHTNLGTLLLDLNRLDEARESYRRALALNPGFRRAVVGDAYALEKLGRFEQGAARLQPYLQAGEVDTNIALAFAALCRPLDRCTEAVALMEGLLGDETRSLSIYERTLLHFSLGKVLDQEGEYARAFEHYHRGNVLANCKFDLPAHADYVAEIIQTCNPAFMNRAPRATHASQRPVFIVGMPRSGTTLVEQILASHPQVFGAGELGIIDSMASSLGTFLGAPDSYPGCLTSLTPESCNQLAGRYLGHLASLAPAEAARVTDKMPTNFIHLGLISLLFPEARIIHCVRDPLDTCLSCYFQNFTGFSFTFDLGHLGAYYSCYRRLMDHWRTVLDVPVMEVRYEDLVADQEGVSRTLIEFCGLTWDDRCLSFYESGRVAPTITYDQVRRPVYNDSVARWRNYAANLEPLRRAMETTCATKQRKLP